MKVLHGDCIDLMSRARTEVIDAIITDPPYGLEFMGKKWDRRGGPQEYQKWCQQWAEQALRVAKPGAHLVSFGGTRTHHRLMSGLEDAGWEIRDCGVWLYRTGFPKSLDVSKAIDKAAGAEREVIGPSRRQYRGGTSDKYAQDEWTRNNMATMGMVETAPATPEAEKWQGWGTALKPAVEPWVLARKPLSEKTVVANVLKWGTGALNIDGCRIGDGPKEAHEAGRWPANCVTLEDDEDLRYFRATIGPVADFPKASAKEKPWDGASSRTMGEKKVRECRVCGSRAKPAGPLNGRPYPSCGHEDWEWVTPYGEAKVNPVLHPTIKPLALMRWLVRLVTPPGGVVLDPFAGSGTTGEAALLEGYDAILIEQEADYLPLIERRLARVTQPSLDL